MATADFPQPPNAYWEQKLVAYLHDPFDKALSIPDHEERARRYLEALDVALPNQTIWKFGDWIAAGFERGALPGYSTNPNQNGAVDFQADPVLTNPIRGGVLKIHPSLLRNWDPARVETFLKSCVARELAPYQKFLYLHSVLRYSLARHNVCGMGALWTRLPADSRIPDHSIWHHNALVSALVSCMNPNADPIPEDLPLNQVDLTRVGILVFTVTPVQPFLARSRKLRDFWTSSLLLSWLAFEGLRWVTEHLGPDHVLYPSLLDQPLMTAYMKGALGREIPELSAEGEVATFPNKGMVLIPFPQAKEIGEALLEHIRGEWRALARLVRDLALPEEAANARAMFDAQVDDFWDLSWTATPLVTESGKPDVHPYLFTDLLAEVQKQIQMLRKMGQTREVGPCYPLSNQVAQGALSWLKASGRHARKDQGGKKCALVPELSALTDTPHQAGMSAKEWMEQLGRFWDTVRNRLGITAEEGRAGSGELAEGEYLSAIGLIKRFLSRALRQRGKGHLLFEAFAEAEGFPSTTEMALSGYFDRENVDPRQRRALAQSLHDADEEKPVLKRLQNRDKYYALLLMDGDRMGQLVMGQTLGATWGTVIHPDLDRRLKSAGFDQTYAGPWRTFGDFKRLVTPALHAAISEALGDFSLYAVPKTIRRFGGRLVYAGGDDVCAILPIDGALPAARELREAYRRFFTVPGVADYEPGETLMGAEGAKLCHGLGDSAGVSLSAAVLIAHHKEPLGLVLREAHRLLDEEAKERAQRDACALALWKRSGGLHVFCRKWDHPGWDSLHALMRPEGAVVTNSLLYALEAHRPALMALAGDLEGFKTYLAELVRHSGEQDLDWERALKAAGCLKDILLDSAGEPSVSLEGARIAAFFQTGTERAQARKEATHV